MEQKNYQLLLWPSVQLCKKPHLSYPYVLIVELVCFGYGLLLSVLFLCLYNI